MKIFITGCTGFLGSFVIERLLKDNHQIVALIRKANAFRVNNIEDDNEVCPYCLNFCCRK